MRISSAAIVAIAVACGGGSPNFLRVRPSPLASVQPPHEAIYVKHRDRLRRVYLDTGATEPWTAELAVTDDVRIAIEAERVIVRRGAESRVVDGVVAGTGSPLISPDRAAFALTQPSEGGIANLVGVDVAVVALDTLAVRRYETGVEHVYGMRWAADGAALWLDTHERWLRLDLATAKVERTIDPPPAATTAAAPEAPDLSAVCPDQGLRLEIVSDRDVQRIVLIAVGTTTAPDTLGAVAPRTLVSADDHYSHPHGTNWPPDLLSDAFFTRSCRHFVFVFGTDVYVGEVATGRFAYVTTGARAQRDPPAPD